MRQVAEQMEAWFSGGHSLVYKGELNVLAILTNV
jgi:hypothetical protein